MAARITFLPSLKHIAIVKIAIAVFYNPRIAKLIDQLQDLENKFGEQANHKGVRERWILIEKQVCKQFRKRFPASLVKKVVVILRALHSEVKKWKRDHEEYITSNHVDYKSILIWNSEGTINRSGTAEEWIRSGILDIHQRFLLACTYFMESIILNLWVEMNEDHKRKLFSKTANLSVRFWTDWLREGAIPACWFQIANESLHHDNVWISDYHIRLSCFFSKIDPFSRRDYLCRNFWRRKIHRDDLRFCYNHMDKFEQWDMFRSNPCDMFITYLDWPLQSHFTKLLDSLPSELSVNAYYWITSYILTDKIQRGWKDADYVEILREIWNRIPTTVKEELKATTVYAPLMIVLDHTKRQPFSIEEILDSYF